MSRVLFMVVQALDGFETTRDSVDGVLPSLMVEAGLEGVAVEEEFKTALGTIAIYGAHRSADRPHAR